jgi:hypothetical protein
MKYLLIEKSKRVSVKPYQRKGKYVIGHQRLDPRDRKAYLDSLVEKVKSLETTGRIRVEKLPTNEQQYLISRGVVFDVDRMGKPLIGYSRARAVQDLREKVSGKKGQPFLTQQEVEEHYYTPEKMEFLAIPERIKSEATVRSIQFEGVSEDVVTYLQTVVPSNELAGLLSVEQFSFHNFAECKTIPRKPYAEYLEEQFKEHPDYGGMYFHDIARLVLDKTNISFISKPKYMKYAMLHEIGHHQWWYHMKSEDLKRWIKIWKTEKVSEYAKTNHFEGFAEAYAHYRIGKLNADKYPETDKFLSEIFGTRLEAKRIPVTLGEPISTSSDKFQNLMSKLDKIRAKEKALVDYPRTDAVIDLLKRVEEANTSKAVKTITEEMDDYLKRGIGWQIEGVKEAGDVFGEVYDYAMEKRKKFITKKYDTTALDEVIRKHKKLAKQFKDIESQQDLVSYLEGLKNTIEDNWKIGLYEESEFPTLKQEVNHAISFLKRKSRKFEWAIGEKAIDSFANLREII